MRESFVTFAAILTISLAATTLVARAAPPGLAAAAAAAVAADHEWARSYQAPKQNLLPPNCLGGYFSSSIIKLRGLRSETDAQGQPRTVDTYQIARLARVYADYAEACMRTTHSDDDFAHMEAGLCDIVAAKALRAIDAAGVDEYKRDALAEFQWVIDDPKTPEPYRVDARSNYERTQAI